VGGDLAGAGDYGRASAAVGVAARSEDSRAGQVVTADGGPVAGALVISVVSVQGQLEGGKDHAQVMSADAGFEVLLGPGVWKPSVFASGFTMATTAIKSGDQTAQLV